MDERTPLTARPPAALLRRRFWWFAVLGLAAIVTLQLSFLPRTSLNRDFRRWHELHLTKTDVKRLFLVQLHGSAEPGRLTVEDRMRQWLETFSALSAKAPAGIAAPAAPDLAAAVDHHMRALGFAPTTHAYPVTPQLRAPVLLSLRLVDSAAGRILYTAPVLEPGSATPAYYPLSANGTVDAPYTYAHDATPADLALLAEHRVPVSGRILVFSHPLASDTLLADKIAAAEALGCAGVVVYGDAAAPDTVSRHLRPARASAGLRLPVSHSAVQPVLEALAPAMAPFQNWPYAPLPRNAAHHLQMAAEFSQLPLHATNIEATLEGVFNDAVVVVGAARDVLTSANPLSGHAVMLEVMRRFQLLRRMGWRPLRAIRFVSWDASRSGALGLAAMVRDPVVVRPNLPVLAYINLDEDAVTGDHFSVEANPLFNKILHETAHFVPFPKNSTHYRRIAKSSGVSQDGGEKSEGTKQTVDSDSLREDSEQNYVIFSGNDGDSEQELSHSENSETSLYHYWFRQDKARINNNVGEAFADKDTGTFQFSYAAPSINIKFKESPAHNDSLYVPESNMYSLAWLADSIDKTYVLHSLLVRYLGLLTLSLGEHEVVDYRTRSYFAQTRLHFDNFVTANTKVLRAWADEAVPASLLEKSVLLEDFKNDIGDLAESSALTLANVVSQISKLLHQLGNQSLIFDEYNKSVQEMWIADYPWYKFLKKVHIYAKFKVANYKLLRLEKGLSLSAEESEKITGHNGTHHIVFEAPTGHLPRAELHQRGAFASMYAAVDAQDMNQLVTIIVALYERFKEVFKKIS